MYFSELMSTRTNKLAPFLCRPLSPSVAPPHTQTLGQNEPFQVGSRQRHSHTHMYSHIHAKLCVCALALSTFSIFTMIWRKWNSLVAGSKHFYMCRLYAWTLTLNALCSRLKSIYFFSPSLFRFLSDMWTTFPCQNRNINPIRCMSRIRCMNTNAECNFRFWYCSAAVCTWTARRASGKIAEQCEKLQVMCCRSMYNRLTVDELRSLVGNNVTQLTVVMKCTGNGKAYEKINFTFAN